MRHLKLMRGQRNCCRGYNEADFSTENQQETPISLQKKSIKMEDQEAAQSITVC
jgi:hypothetical protein